MQIIQRPSHVSHNRNKTPTQLEQLLTRHHRARTLSKTHNYYIRFLRITQSHILYMHVAHIMYNPHIFTQCRTLYLSPTHLAKLSFCTIHITRFTYITYISDAIYYIQTYLMEFPDIIITATQYTNHPLVMQDTTQPMRHLHKLQPITCCVRRNVMHN